MRKEPFFVGDSVHAFNRGNRKHEIVRDDNDRINFLLGLFYLNNKHSPKAPLSSAREFLVKNKNRKDMSDRKDRPNLSGVNNKDRFDLSCVSGGLVWPNEWEERVPLVGILSFTLMDNHFHLVLQEIIEGGVAEFMRKLSNSMTGYFNTKYEETGRLFQGPYKARRVDKDNYLQYLAVYIHIKNVFELYPGGLKNALANFNDAFEFACNYQYSSLGAYFSNRHIAAPVINTNMYRETFKSKKEFKEFARNCMDFVYFDEMSGKINVKNLDII